MATMPLPTSSREKGLPNITKSIGTVAQTNRLISQKPTYGPLGSSWFNGRFARDPIKVSVKANPDIIDRTVARRTVSLKEENLPDPVHPEVEYLPWLWRVPHKIEHRAKTINSTRGRRLPPTVRKSCQRNSVLFPNKTWVISGVTKKRFVTVHGHL